jgi:hypothetical protein
LIKEGLEKLEQLIAAGQKPVALDYLGLTGRAFAMGGEVTNLPPPLRRRAVGSLDDLIAVVKAEPEPDGVTPGPEIWVGAKEVTALWRADDSRESAVFSLSFSAAWKVLRFWAESPQMLEQKLFIRHLVQVFDCDPALVAPWRKLDWTSSARATGEVERTRDRLGREINAQVNGTADLPETIPITVSVFREKGQREKYTVVCQVEIDAAANRIGLLVRDAELSAIEESHLDDILQEIKNELPDVPSYLGQVL